MNLSVIGAGVGRTGSMSLKLALERLLGGRCYHMTELFQHPAHIPLWHQAARGRMPDWESIFTDFNTAVDWPAASFWRELGEAFPNALIVLSLRDAESWWESASTTIFPSIPNVPNDEWRAMIKDMFATRFTSAINDKDAAIAAYERHVADVRANAPGGRLLEWRPGDGWGPLCEALALPVPKEPFPHANSREEFLATFRDGPDVVVKSKDSTI